MCACVRVCEGCSGAAAEAATEGDDSTARQAAALRPTRECFYLHFEGFKLNFQLENELIDH